MSNTTPNKTSNSGEMDAALCLWRFGLGARQGDLRAIAEDPRDLLRSEVTEHAVPIPFGPQLHSSADLMVSLIAFNKQVKAEREKTVVMAVSVDKAMAGPDNRTGMGDMAAAPDIPKDKPANAANKIPYLPQQILLAEVDARFNGTIRQPLIGFGERLAMFWANHFSVAIGKGGDVHMLAGAFEREAIRPHIFGNFEDMLLAVETHPAMLFFLDNQQSIGPNSPANKNGKRGLNENLAREIMELHTLGVDGGYNQADVKELARVITGWTVYRDENKPGPVGRFSFNANNHEPGDHAVMGITYADAGVEQGRRALRDLAHHPSTARHLAFKLARHFVSDKPPVSLVTKIAAAYTKSHGDLAATYLAMLESEEAWDPALTKLRPPLDFVTAILRSSDVKPKPEQIVSVLKALGQPFWDPSGPNGFSDVTDNWGSSEGLATRIDAASLFAHQVAGGIDPRDFVADRFGPLLTRETAKAVQRAETKPQGLTIAFLSPEFQRR
ncbi:DUF1800 domain-containing protein [Agrobacterium salinitolerans]|uniref:DUF1800 domain-containing protein n=1 Tax=Agrobacterium salinitolerans TaxID=1183413 RepID=UPI001571C990|nr:DUF1800 family protein [Agrobacterium salinitolerans]NTA38446.1 DUF1800 family protein [Agrobacterium salinitolerans]